MTTMEKLYEEIAGGRSVIRSFTGDYRFLSNFYPAKIAYEDILFPTAEHLYQARKCILQDHSITDIRSITRIIETNNPKTAKHLGGMAKIRSDWDIVKLDVMLEVVRMKFQQNPLLTERLISTGDSVLIETNWWGDTCFGVCRGVGQNHLGLILMKVREELCRSRR